MDIRPSGRRDGLSLCSGVGGLELGLTIAEPSYRTVAYVERDPFAQRVLAARMRDGCLHDAPIWDDVKTFDAKPWRGSVDILTAGYPCQPFSHAGKRQGEADPRHLWPDIARIIDDCRPGRIFLENVLGHVDIGFDVVARELSSMGYHVAAGLFSAAEVGASHWRIRLFILADANGEHERERDRVADQPEGAGNDDANRPVRKSDCAERSGTKLDFVLDGSSVSGLSAGTGAGELPLFAPAPSDLQSWHAATGRIPALEPCLHGLDHGVAHRMDRTRAAGNGVVSLAAALAYRALSAQLEARLKAP